MKNHEQFLNLCNQFTRLLTEMYHLKNNSTMGYVIRAARYKHPVIKHHYETLSMYVELRNVLVHETYDQVLAEPTDDVVNLMQHIVSRLTDSKTLKDVFKFEVTSFFDDEPIEHLFQIIQQTTFSHFPIFNQEGLLGVLTENGITHFIASKVDEDIISLKDLTIQEVLFADEHYNHYKILKPETLLHEAVEVFDSRQHPVQIAFISHLELIKAPQDIIGFMLPKDVAHIIDDIV